MSETSDLGNGVYKILPSTMLFSASRRVLEDAVHLPTNNSSAENHAFGWIHQAFPAPEESGRYLVEFLDKNIVRIIAYIDRSGRVYTTTTVQTEPFEREPDLSFARFARQPDPSVEKGCVEVRQEDGTTKRVALYESRHGRFIIRDSWYDFGQNAQDLPYDDALCRAYLAFVYRVDQGGLLPPTCGIDNVDEHLNNLPLVEALHAIVADVQLVADDDALKPPALLHALAGWLIDAGIALLTSHDHSALFLVRTVQYSNLYFISHTSGKPTNIPRQTIQQIEAALNRFCLIRDKLKEQAASASRETVGQLFEAAENALLDHLSFNDSSSDETHTQFGYEIPVVREMQGEWDVRTTFSEAVENIRTPYRVEIEFRSNLPAGRIAVVARVPDEHTMPLKAWRKEEQRWEMLTSEERRTRALQYALNFGIVCAALAFRSSPRIKYVDFVGAYPFDTEMSHTEDEHGEFTNTDALRPVCCVQFDRTRFFAESSDRDIHDDPRLFWHHFDGWWNEGTDDANTLSERIKGCDPDDARSIFSDIESDDARARHRDLPEIADGLLPPHVRDRLGARYIRDMRISYGSLRRRDAETLADNLATIESDAEGIRLVKATHDKTTDPIDKAGYTRVMTALARGYLDTSDQNMVVNCYLGTDQSLDALHQARQLVSDEKTEEATQLLLKTVQQSEESGKYSDDDEVVYRVFDSYGSRLIYNLARAGKLRGATKLSFEASEAEKRVELAPDSLYLCYLELGRLFSQSFAHTDDAIDFGRRALKLAPTTASGYRQLARTFMLIGDMKSSLETLDAGLRIATLPGDISISYYQLGYVLWKTGHPQAGALCYLKSVAISPAMVLQAMTELNEILSETEVAAVERDQLDAELSRAGIVVAPTTAVLDAMLEGAAAATDAGLFSCARSLLATHLRYRPDDALTNVIRSFTETQL